MRRAKRAVWGGHHHAARGCPFTRVHQCVQGLGMHAIKVQALRAVDAESTEAEMFLKVCNHIIVQSSAHGWPA